jgi:hypothetical protein
MYVIIYNYIRRSIDVNTKKQKKKGGQTYRPLRVPCTAARGAQTTGVRKKNEARSLIDLLRVITEGRVPASFVIPRITGLHKIFRIFLAYLFN